MCYSNPVVIDNAESRGNMSLLHNSAVNNDLQEDANTTIAIIIMIVT